MKTTTLAALAALALLTGAPALAADPDVKCKQFDGFELCGADDGTYQITGSDWMMQGRCGGNVSWQGLAFPQASGLHRLMCGDDAHLELR